MQISRISEILRIDLNILLIFRNLMNFWQNTRFKEIRNYPRGPTVPGAPYQKTRIKTIANCNYLHVLRIFGNCVFLFRFFKPSCIPNKTKRKTSRTQRNTSKCLRKITIFGFWGVLNYCLFKHHQNAPSRRQKTHGSPKLAISLKLLAIVRSLKGRIYTTKTVS